MAVLPKRILAIDVGERRIGLAIADAKNKLPNPFKTIINSDTVLDEICKTIDDESIDTLVVGLPRNLDGKETQQTKYVINFVDDLKLKTNLKLYLEDEALSSVRAKNFLRLTDKPYKKEAIDALAASYILDDFLISHKELFNA